MAIRANSTATNMIHSWDIKLENCELNTMHSIMISATRELGVFHAVFLLVCTFKSNSNANL